jgi:DNA repair protein RadD
MPTGSGKTTVIGLAPYFISNIKNVLILTPRKNLRDQLVNDLSNDEKNLFKKFNIINDKTKIPYLLSLKKGEINDNITRSNGFVVSTFQKFATNKEKYKILEKDSFDLIIVDEAHHLPAKYWNKIINHFKFSKKLFLTATPYRTDCKFKDFIKFGFTTKLSRKDVIGFIREIEFIELTDEKSESESENEDEKSESEDEKSESEDEKIESKNDKSESEDEESEDFSKKIKIVKKINEELNNQDLIFPLKENKKHQKV